MSRFSSRKICWHCVPLYTLTWLKMCFYSIQGHLVFAQVLLTFACDLIHHGEMHHFGAGTCFSTFLAQMTPHSQKRNILMLSLYRSHSDNMCTRLHLLIEWPCECTSSTNESLYYSAIMMISPFCVLHHATEGSAFTFTTINTLECTHFDCAGVSISQKSLFVDPLDHFISF